MPFAPDLRGAFLFGEGNHGWYNEKTRRYQDDLWFYDANANRWVCVYPGAHVDQLDLKVNAEGFEATKEGEPIPVATMVHAYEMLTYDTDLRRFMSMNASCNYWMGALAGRRKAWLGALDPDKSWGDMKRCAAASPWFFDTQAGRWGRRATQGPEPQTSFGDILMYVPARRQVFFHNWNSGRNLSWYYDPAKNAWTQISSKGPGPPFGGDMLACYDSRRDRIYLGQGKLWVFDIKTETWIDPRPKAPVENEAWSAHSATLTYDTVNDAVVLIQYRNPGKGVHVYDPAANTWAAAHGSTPKEWDESLNMNGFYDPVLNAHFVHAAVDNAPGGVWTYRYRAPRKR